MSSLSAAETIGDYTVVEQLEATGRELYAANKDGSSYVLVVFAADATSHRALDEEVRRSMLLDDPAIVRASDSFAHGNRQVLAFEALEGVTLLRLMRLLDAEDTQLSDGAVTYLGAELMRALSEAHEAKDARGKRKALIHGELGPHQLLINWSGQLMIMGVGLSPIFDLSAKHGRTPSWMRPYQAPEVRDGKPTSVRANAYSAALVLWSLFTHRTPPGPDDGPPESLAGARPDLARAIASRIDQTLSERPYTRTGCSLLAKVLASRVADGDKQSLVDTLSELRVLVSSTPPVPTESIPPSSFDDDELEHPSDAPPAGEARSKRHTKMMGAGTLHSLAAIVPVDKRPTTSTRAATPPAPSSDRVAVSAPRRGATPLPAASDDAPRGPLPPRRSTLPSLSVGPVGDELASDVEPSPPGAPPARQGRTTKLLGAVSKPPIQIDVVDLPSEPGAKSPFLDPIDDEVSLDWDLAPLDFDSHPGADDPDSDPGTAKPTAKSPARSVSDDDLAAGPRAEPASRPADSEPAATKPAGSSTNDALALPSDDGDDGRSPTASPVASLVGPQALAPEAPLTPSGHPPPAELTTEASANSLSLPPAATDAVPLSQDYVTQRGGALRWAGAAVALIAIGLIVWFATGSPASDSGAETSATNASAIATTLPSTAAPVASTATPDPPSSAAPPSSASSASASASAAASATTSASAVPDEPPHNADPKQLPADKGYLVVNAPYHPDTEVYVNGTHLGKAGRPLVVTCGKPSWVRLGTVPLSHWYGAGKAVAVDCQTTKQITINTAPQPTANPTDGDLYE